VRVAIDRAARRTVVEVQLGSRRAVVRHLPDAGDVVQAVPLRPRSADGRAAADRGLPAAEGPAPRGS
jgi:hypothetical protein